LFGSGQRKERKLLPHDTHHPSLDRALGGRKRRAVLDSRG
jgi:hypothetical protein